MVIVSIDLCVSIFLFVSSFICNNGKGTIVTMLTAQYVFVYVNQSENR